MSQEIREVFVVTAQQPSESLEQYLTRILGDFEKRIKFVLPTLTEGHQQKLEFSEAGTTLVQIKPEHRITNVVVAAGVGASAYTHYIQLSESREQDNKDGDKVAVYFKAPLSTNPTIRVKDQDGVDIDSITFNGSGNDSLLKTYIKVNDAWQR